MSFFKKFKDKLTAPNARISLQLDKSGYTLGENVQGKLSVTSNEEFDAKEIRCEFQCVETAKRTVPQYDPAAKREVMRQVQQSATLYSAKPIFDGQLHMTAGLSQTIPISINIPAGGRPTFHSLDSNVLWSLKGVIAVDGRPDVTSNTAEIQVSAQAASPVIKEREVIHEVVMIPCKYCGGLMPQTDTACPNCGAKRTV